MFDDAARLATLPAFKVEIWGEMGRYGGLATVCRRLSHACSRPPPLPLFPKVDLRGATVSNPLHSPAAGSRSARILLRERDGRTHEMAAPSAAEAGAWVGGSVAHATASCERRLFTRVAL